ncbi:uncharacterized protein B0H64DRAFT_362504 [Chaetomium fimeti]|uniref:Uncharacterized protein n=1 Tax=Chaetomium fimeti TaxID=1854472 RepID=A0AAE0LS57_9PEZI|nr:hypothetical protein B0H64DRAFT_362504 [Chaetomium fimeti]
MNSSSPQSRANAFPFTLAANNRELNRTTSNAIDAHLMEIALTRRPTTTGNQDTVLAIVTFPKDDRSSIACDGVRWGQDIKLRMSYDKLTSLGSKKIQDMFAPRAQARFRRRFGFERDVQLPPGIKYVLDFTPPAEGAELADLTAALWLPRMVKLWFLAGQYYPDSILEEGIGHPTRPLANKAVGAILTLGHDDVCKNLACLTDYAEWQCKDQLPGIVDDPADGPSHIPSWRKVEDYCPIRHRVAIVRVLKAINGDGLLLNSAVRLWTVAQVAISLEVPQVVVDPVTQWLVAPPNTKFIEICPEIAFRLAYSLKIPSVLTAAFKILVNELAVDYASSDPGTRRAPMTWAQRQRDDWGDYPSDPVEYASHAFADRMGETLKMLRSDHVLSNLSGPIQEWDKLQAYGAAITASFAPDHVLSITYKTLTAALLAAFHGWVDNALDLDSFNTLNSRRDELLEAQRKHYIPSVSRKPLISLYWTLKPAQKLLTPFFWDHLICIQPRSEFNANNYGGTPLWMHADSFNLELQRALAEAVAPPYDPAPGPIINAAADSPNPAATNPLVAAVLAHMGAGQLIPELAAVNLDNFYHQLSREVRLLGGQHLPSHAQREDESANGIPLFLSDHLLLSLDERELAYLPIWADGLDDGSGGVFQAAIPPADMGPSEPGPAYHTGYTIPSGTLTTGTATASTVAPPSSIAPSDLDLADLTLGKTTGTGTGTSTSTSTSSRTDDWVMATPTPTGTSSTAADHRSLAAQRSGTASTTAPASMTEGRSGGIAGTPSEAFTSGDDEDGLYTAARYAQPAGHQAQGVAIERYVDELEGEEKRAEGEVEVGWDSDEMELDLDSDSDDGSSTVDGFEDVGGDVVR